MYIAVVKYCEVDCFGKVITVLTVLAVLETEVKALIGDRNVPFHSFLFGFAPYQSCFEYLLVTQANPHFRLVSMYFMAFVHCSSELN